MAVDKHASGFHLAREGLTPGDVARPRYRTDVGLRIAWVPRFTSIYRGRHGFL